MKKLLFTAYDLNVGGIEKALVTLLKNLKGYDITLILEHKEGIFLDQIPQNIKVIEYKVSTSKFILFRKIYNRLKLIFFKLKIKNKYDFSCSFATYSIPGAYLALAASNNNALWIHSNYYKLYNNNKTLLKQFLDSVLIKHFKYNIYVSKDAMHDILQNYSGIHSKAIVCNNLIDSENIIKLSNERIYEQKEEVVTFVNIGRHEERAKRLTRIFNACVKLKEEGFKFRVLMIGDGPDNNFYKCYVTQKKLDDIIVFCGKKKNPYPYYKIADAIVLSSSYEGYPVVFLESLIFNKPIISTKVSDWNDLDGKYGIFVNNDDNSIYYGMKQILNNGFKIEEKFDADKYNNEILEILENIINK